MRKSNIKSYKVKVNSSLIESLEYDFPRLKMRVRFRRGKSKKRSYNFEQVTPDQFHRILYADSIGRAVLKLRGVSFHGS